MAIQHEWRSRLIMNGFLRGRSPSMNGFLVEGFSPRQWFSTPPAATYRLHVPNACPSRRRSLPRL